MSCLGLALWSLWRKIRFLEPVEKGTRTGQRRMYALGWRRSHCEVEVKYISTNGEVVLGALLIVFVQGYGRYSPILNLLPVDTDRTWLERLIGLGTIFGGLSRLLASFLFLDRSCHYIVLGGCDFFGTTSLTMQWWLSWTVCSNSKKRWRKAKHDFVFLTGQYPPVWTRSRTQLNKIEG